MRETSSGRAWWTRPDDVRFRFFGSRPSLNRQPRPNSDNQPLVNPDTSRVLTKQVDYSRLSCVDSSGGVRIVMVDRSRLLLPPLTDLLRNPHQS